MVANAISGIHCRRRTAGNYLFIDFCSEKPTQVLTIHPSYIRLIVFSIGITALLLAVDSLQDSLIYKWSWILIIYFTFLSAINFQFINFALKKNGGNIVPYYFGSMTVRFLVSILIVFLVIYIDRENSISFAINFIILYLLFLGFEIFWLIKRIESNEEDVHHE